MTPAEAATWTRGHTGRWGPGSRRLSGVYLLSSGGSDPSSPHRPPLAGRTRRPSAMTGVLLPRRQEEAHMPRLQAGLRRRAPADPPLLQEEEILKLASLGNHGNLHNAVDVLKRSLAIQNKAQLYLESYTALHFANNNNSAKLKCLQGFTEHMLFLRKDWGRGYCQFACLFTLLTELNFAGVGLNELLISSMARQFCPHPMIREPSPAHTVGSSDGPLFIYKKPEKDA